MTRRMKRQFVICFLLAVILALPAACAPAPPASTPAPQATLTRTGAFTPYASPAASDTPQPAPASSGTPLPSPTPTPRVHVVARGEDLFGISLRYQVSLDDIRRLNPDINPNLLTVGQELLIPASTLTPPDFTPQPTPMVLPVVQPRCLPTGEGGAWCFALVRNDQDFAVESVTLTFRLAAVEDGAILSQPGFAALDLVRPGEEVPVMAYFSPPVPVPFTSGAELDQALPAAQIAERYAAVQVNGEVVNLSPDGLSAQVRGTVQLASDSAHAGQVRVAAVAYEVDGQIAGVRVWEPDDQVLAPGAELPFEFAVFSAAGPIVRVDFYAEGQPRD